MRNQKKDLYEDIIEYMMINDICLIECNNKELPEFLVVIEGKAIWIEIKKAKRLEEFSNDMVLNGCLYLYVEEFEHFKRSFVSYVLSERMGEKNEQSNISRKSRTS